MFPRRFLHPIPALVFALFTFAAENPPVTPVESLAGQKLSFPTSLAGKPAVCVFGFSQEAGDGTKDWMKRFYQDGVNAWSVASLEKAPSLLRGIIKSSMRKGTPQQALEHSLVMTKDEEAWKRVLAEKNDKLPLVVVLDSAGRIAWAHEASLSEEAYREVKSRLLAVSK